MSARLSPPEPVRATLRPQLAARAVAKRVGLVVLATDHTSEGDYARLVAGPEIGVYVNRVPYANPITPASLRAMQPDLTAAAALILPDEPLDVISYACTSASVVIGDAEVAAALRAAKPGAQVVTPPKAAVAGLAALGATRLAVLTPYTFETTRAMAGYFAGAGLELTRVTCLDMEDDREMARIDRASLVAAAREAMTDDAEALFISCTALRSAAAVAEIEAALGKPVVTSNQAAAWMCLRLCGDASDRPGGGRLMRLALPPDDTRDRTAS